jgi:hypothetical protein
VSKLACELQLSDTTIRYENMLKFIRVRFILLACLLGMTPAISSAQVTITIAPPELPVYEQPLCPGDGYIWTPGYWAYGTDDYYWIPGVWILAPQPGFLWTPGYWGFEGGNYGWHAGYWGPHIGFYGGVNYGFGYFGSGFAGGRWEGGHFFCNTAVWHVNRTVVHNTYVDRTVIKNVTVNRVSFNGTGGIDAKPTAEEDAAAHEQHVEATDAQRTHEENSLRDNNQRFSVNKGQPTKVAVTKVGGQEVKNPAGNAEKHKEATTGEHKEATPEKNKEQVTKPESKGNEPANQEKHEKKAGEENKGNRPGEPEKPKAEGQNKEHHEAKTAAPSEEKNKGEKGKGEKGKDEKDKKE